MAKFALLFLTGYALGASALGNVQESCVDDECFSPTLLLQTDIKTARANMKAQAAGGTSFAARNKINKTGAAFGINSTKYTDAPSFSTGDKIEVAENLEYNISVIVPAGSVGRVLDVDENGSVTISAGEHSRVTVESQDLAKLKKKVLDSEAAPDSAAAAQGVSQNGAGDMTIFLSGLQATIGMIVFCVMAFMYLRSRFPLTYRNNIRQGIADPEAVKRYGLDEYDKAENPSVFSLEWLRAAFNIDIEESSNGIGLDNALLLMFCDMCMKIMACIAVPMVCITGVANAFFGGNAAGEDHLSYLSFGNVEKGSNLYWMHAVTVWLVCFFTSNMVEQYNGKFLVLRERWLQNLPDERARTVLVEGLPEEADENFRSDEAVRKFFNGQLGKVESVWVTKDTSVVRTAIANFQALRQEIVTLEQREGTVPIEKRTELQVKSDLVKQEQRNVRQQAATQPGHLNLWTAHVTFVSRKDAEVAKRLVWDKNQDHWQITDASEPRDIKWNDLSLDPNTKSAWTAIGYVLVAGLYFAYMPLVILITKAAVAVDLGPILQPFWASLAPTMGLTFMVAMLPTFLVLIFTFAFPLSASALLQFKLQRWYFWFQIVFVVLVTAIGPSVYEFTETLFTNPFGVFALLGTALPYATHFYMNFLVLQWATHCMNLMRYVNLSKWFAFKKLGFSEEEARQMSEPEDQDYYGLGARTARFTINMVIGLVYGTLSPPVCVLTFINFLVCRIVYGYLVNFAESKKADLGGVFWNAQCHHIFTGLVIYTVCMTGVLSGRAATGGPAAITSVALVYVIVRMRRFHAVHQWEVVSYPAIQETPQARKVLASRDSEYVQPEMREGIVDIVKKG